MSKDIMQQLEEDLRDPYAEALDGLNQIAVNLAERVVNIEKYVSETPSIDKIQYKPKNSKENLDFVQIINDLYEKIEIIDKKVDNLHRWCRK